MSPATANAAHGKHAQHYCPFGQSDGCMHEVGSATAIAARTCMLVKLKQFCLVVSPVFVYPQNSATLSDSLHGRIQEEAVSLSPEAHDGAFPENSVTQEEPGRDAVVSRHRLKGYFDQRVPAVSSHSFDSRHFNLRVSNPNKRLRT